MTLCMCMSFSHVLIPVINMREFAVIFSQTSLHSHSKSDLLHTLGKYFINYEYSDIESLNSTRGITILTVLENIKGEP